MKHIGEGKGKRGRCCPFETEKRNSTSPSGGVRRGFQHSILTQIRKEGGVGAKLKGAKSEKKKGKSAHTRVNLLGEKGNGTLTSYRAQGVAKYGPKGKGKKGEEAESITMFDFQLGGGEEKKEKFNLSTKSQPPVVKEKENDLNHLTNGDGCGGKKGKRTSTQVVQKKCFKGHVFLRPDRIRRRGKGNR